jgi:hypothetical protein
MNRENGNAIRIAMAQLTPVALSAGDRLRFTMLQSINATSWLRLVTSSLRKIP